MLYGHGKNEVNTTLDDLQHMAYYTQSLLINNSKAKMQKQCKKVHT